MSFNRVANLFISIIFLSTVANQFSWQGETDSWSFWATSHQPLGLPCKNSRCMSPAPPLPVCQLSQGSCSLSLLGEAKGLLALIFMVVKTTVPDFCIAVLQSGVDH